MKDYYKILGLSKDANADDISVAYRKLARQFHPDLNPNNPEAVESFKAVSEAYEHLGDPEKRARYDNPYQHQGNPMDFFAQIFGGSVGPQRRREIQLDMQMHIELDFIEAAKGCNKDIQAIAKELCQTCNAVGWMQSTTCNECGGKGVRVVSSGHSFFQTPCNVCNGNGKINTDKCSECNEGFKPLPDEDVSIRIPAGVDTGATLRLRHKGDYDRSGRRGDLYVTIHVRPHVIFQRHGLNLHCKIPVSYSKLALGGDITVPALKEQFVAKVPAGTSNGAQLKLRGKGIVDEQGHTGDLIVLLVAQTPTDLSEEYVVKLQELAELEEKYPTKEILEFNNLLNIYSGESYEHKSE